MRAAAKASTAAEARRAAQTQRAAERANQKATGRRAVTAAAAEKAATAQAQARRAAARRAAVVPRAVATKFTTVDLNVRTRAATSASVTAVLAPRSKVAVTSVRDGGWQQVVFDGQAGWVRAEYLSATRPAVPAAPRSETRSSGASTPAPRSTPTPRSTPAKPSASAKSSSSSSGGSTRACASGSAVESGLTADAIRVHRAICSAFPQVTSYGGVRADSLPAHPSGRALDAMVSDSSLGWQIANWVRANRARLGVSEVIYAQKIWTLQRGGEGWRSMPDRGSATANHYDHVHVTVFGSSGTG